MFSRYHIIKNEEELHQLIRCCIESGYASVDFETNGQSIYMNSFRPTILSVTFKAGFGCSIPLAHFSMPEDHPWVEWLTKFGRRVVENPKVTKIAWNWKFDNQIFHRYHIYHEGTVIDGMLAKYILNEERPNGLKDMVRRYLPDFTDYEKSEGFDKIPWDKKELGPLCEYGCMDTDMTFRLGLFFESKLIKGKYYPLYRNLIMAASRVLQSAEEFGLPLDIELNKRLREKYAKLISDCTEKLMNNPVVYKYNLDMLINKRNQYISKIRGEIEDLSVNPEKNKRSIATREAKISRVLAGEYQTKEEKALIEPINFGSQKQMVGLLFSKEGFNFPVLEYTVNKDTKQQSDNPSTSEATLLKLKEYDKTGFIDTLLELRGHQTINSTFIVGLGDLVQDDKRVHPTFLIIGTTSGRLSSRNPNGQNIPKTMVNPDVKLQFIPPEGHLFFTYDYSQAELRILAHLAGEETMLEWFRTGKDIHLASACKKYHENYDEILKIYEDEQNPQYKLWKKRRKQAKCINFGIVYEQSAPKLAESLSTPEEQVSVEEAQEFLDVFFSDFPKVKAFMDRQHKFMEDHGYVRSLFGRRRRCPKVYSESYREYLEALRQSTNMPCQSAASDMALFASVLVYEKVRKGELPPMVEADTVHDSVYQFIQPQYITPDTVFKVWDICRNPSTKEYFGFSIDDVDMSMDFTIGRTMAEELPYVPGYDYKKMLSPDFNLDEYYEEHRKVKEISIKEYPEKFKEYFETSWRQRK